MAAGKAVIGVDEGGYRETVVPGETGWLVAANPVSLADRIAAVQPDRLEGMRAACERRAASFDSRAFVDRMRSVVVETKSGTEADK
jgi:glycosyltransferase involved in cell wall biosynthesis